MKFQIKRETLGKVLEERKCIMDLGNTEETNVDKSDLYKKKKSKILFSLKNWDSGVYMFLGKSW